MDLFPPDASRPPPPAFARLIGNAGVAVQDDGSTVEGISSDQPSLCARRTARAFSIAFDLIGSPLKFGAVAVDQVWIAEDDPFRGENRLRAEPVPGAPQEGVGEEMAGVAELIEDEVKATSSGQSPEKGAAGKGRQEPKQPAQLPAVGEQIIARIDVLPGRLEESAAAEGKSEMEQVLQDMIEVDQDSSNQDSGRCGQPPAE